MGRILSTDERYYMTDIHDVEQHAVIEAQTDIEAPYRVAIMDGCGVCVTHTGTNRAFLLEWEDVIAAALEAGIEEAEPMADSHRFKDGEVRNAG